MKKQGVKPSVVDRCRNPAALEKKCKKPLDKLSRVCYTIDVEKNREFGISLLQTKGTPAQRKGIKL